jgi:hypothetical protein
MRGPALHEIFSVFFAFFVIFLDRHSLGDVCCGYSRDPRWRAIIETSLPEQ